MIHNQRACPLQYSAPMPSRRQVLHHFARSPGITNISGVHEITKNTFLGKWRPDRQMTIPQHFSPVDDILRCSYLVVNEFYQHVIWLTMETWRPLRGVTSESSRLCGQSRDNLQMEIYRAESNQRATSSRTTTGEEHADDEHHPRQQQVSQSVGKSMIKRTARRRTVWKCDNLSMRQ